MSTALASEPADTLGATGRIAALRAQIMALKGSFLPEENPFLRDAALVLASHPDASRVEQRAGRLRRLVDLAPVAFPPQWSLAGEHLPHDGGFSRRRPDAARHLAALGIDDAARAERLVQAWNQGAGIARTADCGTADDSDGLGHWNDTRTDRVFWSLGWMENHSIRDYATLLREGYAGLHRRIQARLDALRLDDPDTPRQGPVLRALRTVCDAGLAHARRWSEAAAEAARAATTVEERGRLARMAATCARVPAQGATTLHEAVQALWLGHVLACGDDGINANSLGRLDRILEPYYQADLAAGRITRDGAVELMAELACKLYLDYDVQAITVGGVDADGRDATGEMTGIILDATEQVGFVRDLSLRLHPASPPGLVERACRLIVRGGGIPFLFNDACFVPALTGLGVSERDARDYAPIGCVELTIPGKANPRAVSGWFNLAKCVELALFGGVDPQSGRRLGPATGGLAAHADLDSLIQAVLAQMDHFAARMVYHCNRGQLRQRELGPLPAWSLLTDDCIARGRDITDGGALYDWHSIALLGVVDAADALAAIDALVFGQDAVEPALLLAALRADWQGHEALRRRCLEACPKYGNDQAAPDLLAARLNRAFIDRMDAARSPGGGRYAVHLFSFYCNLGFGRTVGALPDGRRSGEPLAYSLSAHQGRDQRGITALLQSLARQPHERAAGGSAAIIEVDPAAVAGEAGIRRLADLTRAAFAMGVGQIQWNVVSADRLRQAQADPEHHGNLAVRVAGYSQMFRLIDRPLQDHIIARTKHRS